MFFVIKKNTKIVKIQAFILYIYINIFAIYLQFFSSFIIIKKNKKEEEEEDGI